MEHHSRRSTLLKLVITVLLTVIFTAAIIAGILLYKGTFNNVTYSDWLFYAAIAYIALAVVPVYDVLSSSNNVAYKFGEYAVKGKIENLDRINSLLERKNYKFSILMIIVSVFLFILAAFADRLF